MSSTSTNHLAVVSLMLVGILIFSVTAVSLQPLIFHASSNNDLTVVETITGGDRVMTPCPEDKQAVDFIESGKPSKYSLPLKHYHGEHKGHAEVAAITESSSIISDTTEIPPTEASVEWRQFISKHTIPSSTVSTLEEGANADQNAAEHHSNNHKHCTFH